MNCQVCQKELAPGVTACPNCGHSVAPAPYHDASVASVVTPGSVSAGSAIGQGFRLWFSNFVFVTKIILVVWLPIEVIKNYLIYAAGAQDSPGLFRIEGLLAEFVGTLVTAAMLFGVVETIRTGKNPSVRDCYRWGMSRWGIMIAATVGAGLQIILGLVLLVIPGLIFWTWYALVEQVVVVESVSAKDALRRSRELSKGHRLKLVGFGAFFLFYAILVFFGGGMAIGIHEAWWTAALMDCIFDVALVLPNIVLLVFYLQLQQQAGITLDAKAASA